MTAALLALLVILPVRDLRTSASAYPPPLATLTLTLPTRNALGRRGCAVGPDSLLDLTWVNLYLCPQSDPAHPTFTLQRIAHWDVRGMTGERVTFAIPPVTGYGSGWLTVEDDGGNEAPVSFAAGCGRTCFRLGTPP